MFPIVIYTAITSEPGDNILRSRVYPVTNFPAFLFTNIPKYRGPAGWRVIFLDNPLKLVAQKLARYVKTHPHTLLPPHDVSLWVDGTVEVLPRRDSILEFCSFTHQIELRCRVHDALSCTYQELEVCEALKLDPDITTFIKQRAFYDEKEHFPWNWGMLVTNILARKNSSKVNEFNDLWWSQIYQYSVHDQCSIMYALWKTNLLFDATRKKYPVFVQHVQVTTRHYYNQNIIKGRLVKGDLITGELVKEEGFKTKTKRTDWVSGTLLTTISEYKPPLTLSDDMRRLVDKKKDNDGDKDKDGDNDKDGDKDKDNEKKDKYGDKDKDGEKDKDEEKDDDNETRGSTQVINHFSDPLILEYSILEEEKKEEKEKEKEGKEKEKEGQEEDIFTTLQKLITWLS